jgi:hypothetical protein
MKRWGLVLVVVVLTASTGCVSAAVLPDELPVRDSLDTTGGPGETRDPMVSRLFFLPTFEVLPRGQGTFGTIELFFWHAAYSPFELAQIGITAAPFPRTLGSVGAKFRLWRSPNRALGVAVGANHAIVGWRMGDEEFAEFTTGYFVAGYKRAGIEAHMGLLVIGSRVVDHTTFAPLPTPEFPGRRTDKSRSTLGVLGLAAPLPGRGQVMLELWGLRPDMDTWPLVLPGVRYFGDKVTLDVVFLPFRIEDDHVDFGLPIFNLSYYFD